MDTKKVRQHILAKDEHDEEFEKYIAQLLKQDGFEKKTAVHGIAQKIASDGVDSLSEYQLTTFIQYGLTPNNYVDECERCLQTIPWSEMNMAVESGLCSYCEHLERKD